MWLGNAHVQGSITHQGSASVDVRRDADGEGSNPNDILGKLHSSTLVDLFLGYDWGKYSAELFATNVFDERNELSRFVACSVCTVAYVLPGRPRTIGLRLGTRF
jgi:outer membrane receptor protein involved in Fe transport